MGEHKDKIINRIKEYETGEHCFGEILRVDGVDYEDISKDEILELIDFMMKEDVNKESFTRDIYKLALENLQFEYSEGSSDTCEQCGNWNSYQKYKNE